jgi:transcriptional antiterminator RfaH
MEVKMNLEEQSSSINSSAGLCWFVVQTKPNAEHRVETHLFNQKIEVFLPLTEAHQYRNGNIIQTIKPLFPNYLFARLDLKLHYCRVKWTRGVSKLLGFGDGPIPISDKVIQMIKERTSKDNLVKLEEELKEGDVVQITSGPFKELNGIFQKKISDNGRVRILLNLIGVDVPVQIGRWQIKRAA